MKYVFLLMMIIGASFCVMAGEDANPIDCESISSTTIDGETSEIATSNKDTITK